MVKVTRGISTPKPASAQRADALSQYLNVPEFVYVHALQVRDLCRYDVSYYKSNQEEATIVQGKAEIKTAVDELRQLLNGHKTSSPSGENK
ncbi:hypothetical protein EVAR_4919_1 [Eumeta japonica]|uniref:Uncharacterized protein n=1 Tax=Eumeta variegata TaxID=151549 RepID=A0A4C1XYM1_EUMVA|nr:hypothetical protein EVAR_4919_1 [Eumeta japonica]